MTNDNKLNPCYASVDKHHPPGWLSAEEGEFLRLHASRATNPNILEIGSLAGRSASFILEGLKKAFPTVCYQLLCVDPWSTARPYFEQEYGLIPLTFWGFMCKNSYRPHISLLQTTSNKAAPLVLQNQYEFAFIDGNHVEPWVTHDIILCSQVTNTIFLHDYADEEDIHVKRSVDYWIENTSWEIKEQVNRTVKIQGPLFENSICFQGNKNES